MLTGGTPALGEGSLSHPRPDPCEQTTRHPDEMARTAATNTAGGTMTGASGAGAGW